MPFAENVRRDGDLPPLAASQVLVHNGTLYVVGGSDFENGPSDNVYTLPLTKRILAGRTPPPQSLASLQSLPMRLAGHLVGLSSNQGRNARIRVLGGLTQNAEGRWVFPPRRMYEYNATADAWTSVNMPSNDQLASVMVPAEAGVDTNIQPNAQFSWAFGGRVDGPGDARVRDGLIQVAINGDPITAQAFNRRREEQNWPPPRLAPLVMSLNSTHVFVSGGFVERGGRDIEYLSDWWLYNVPEATWTKGEQPMIAGRASHRAVIVNDRYVVHTGGWTRTSAAPFFEYVDLVTGRVSVLSVPRTSNDPAPVPTPTLTMHNSLLVRNQLLLFGGYAEFNQSSPALRHNPNLFIAQIDTRPNDPSTPIRALWLTAYVPSSTGDSTGDSTGEQSTGSPTLGGHSKLSVALISGAVSACVVFLMFGLAFAFVYMRRRDTFSALFGNGNRPNRHLSARSKPSFTPIPIRPHFSTVPSTTTEADHASPSRPPRPASDSSTFTSLPGQIMEPTTHLLDGVRQYRDPTTGAGFHSDWSSSPYPHASEQPARVLSVVESKVSRISSWDAACDIMAIDQMSDRTPAEAANGATSEASESPPSVLQQLVRQYHLSSHSSTDAGPATHLTTPSKSPRFLSVPLATSASPEAHGSPRLHQRLGTTSTQRTTHSSLFDSPLSPIQPQPSRRLPSTLLTSRQVFAPLAPKQTARSATIHHPRPASRQLVQSSTLRLSRAQHQHPLHPTSIVALSDSPSSTNASPRLVPFASLPRSSQPRSTSVPADIVAAVMFTMDPKLQPPPANGVGSPLSTRAEIGSAKSSNPPRRPSQLRPMSAVTCGSSATVSLARASGRTELDLSREPILTSVAAVADTSRRGVHAPTRSYEPYAVDDDDDDEIGLSGHNRNPESAAADSTLPSYILARSVSDSARASSSAPDDPNATHNDDEEVVIYAGTIIQLDPGPPAVSAPPAIRRVPPHLRLPMEESETRLASGGAEGHTGYLSASSMVANGNSLGMSVKVTFPPPAATTASTFMTVVPPLQHGRVPYEDYTGSAVVGGGESGSCNAMVDDSGAELDPIASSSVLGVGV